MNANKHSPHFTDTHFMYFHFRGQSSVRFYSRTTSAPLQTNGLLSGSHEQLSQYTYTAAAAVDNALWFVSLHTISMQRIVRRGEDRCNSWMAVHGKVRVACKVFLVCKVYIRIHLCCV